MLTGKYTENTSEPTRFNREAMKVQERTQNIIEEVRKVAEETGRSRAQVAINWVRQQRSAQMIPILGARKLEQLEDNLAVLEWELSAEQLKRLDEVSRIDLGFPHDWHGSPYVFGATFDKIDNHRA